MYAIEWLPKAVKQLKRIDIRSQKTVYHAVGALENWPDCRNVKALTGRPGYRLRVGRYRVLFEVFDTLRIVEVQEVKKRDERTY